MARYPLFGRLVSIGDHTIPASCDSYLSDDPFAYTPSSVFYTGASYPQDAYGGGAAPLATQMTWVYAVRAPSEVDATGRGLWVETEWEALRALLEATHDDGTAGRTLTLTVAMLDGTNVSAPVEFISAPIRASDRHQGQLLLLNLVFLLHGPFEA